MFDLEKFLYVVLKGRGDKEGSVADRSNKSSDKRKLEVPASVSPDI